MKACPDMREFTYKNMIMISYSIARHHYLFLQLLKKNLAKEVMQYNQSVAIQYKIHDISFQHTTHVLSSSGNMKFLTYTKKKGDMFARTNIWQYPI